MVKAIIFDLQGTLIENGVYPSPLRQVKNILRIDAPFSDFVMRFERVLMTEKHPSLKDAFSNMCEEFHLPPKEYLLEKLVGLWNKNKLLSQLYPDTLQVLEELKENYKLVLVANIDGFSKDIIDRFKLREYFDLVILSCDTGLLKNDKAFYNDVMDKFNLDPDDLLMVGDSLESDIDTAKSVGIKGVLVDRRNKREYEPRIVTLNELHKYL
jgi:HAD superfamily hydrolase (TIGR01493 family)